MNNIKIWFLTWVSGFTKLIDGLVLLVSFGMADLDLTEEIVREIDDIYFRMRYRF